MPRFAFHSEPRRRRRPDGPVEPSLFDRLSQPRSRRGASPASAKAAARAKVTAGEVMRRALEAYAVAGANYNADEVARAIGIHFIRVRPRVCELHQLGFLVPYRIDPTNLGSDQVQRDSDQGSPADVWQITPAGLAALRAGPLPRLPRPKKVAA